VCGNISNGGRIQHLGFLMFASNLSMYFFLHFCGNKQMDVRVGTIAWWACKHEKDMNKSLPGYAKDASSFQRRTSLAP